MHREQEALAARGLDPGEVRSTILAVAVAVAVATATAIAIAIAIATATAIIALVGNTANFSGGRLCTLSTARQTRLMNRPPRVRQLVPPKRCQTELNQGLGRAVLKRL